MKAFQLISTSFTAAFDLSSGTFRTTIGETCTRVSRPSGKLQRSGDSCGANLILSTDSSEDTGYLWLMHHYYITLLKLPGAQTKKEG